MSNANKLRELLDDHQLYHSKFQQDNLITTRAGGTLYGQYKQSLRELYKRFRSLRDIFCNIELEKIELEELEHKISNSKDEFQKRKNEIELRRRLMKQEETDRIVRDTKREFKRFFEQAIFLKEQVGELTEERREMLDCELWEYRLKEMAALDILTFGRLQKPTLEIVKAIPQKDRNKFLQIYKEPKKLLAWYEKGEEFHLPDEIPRIEINEKQLLERVENLLLEHREENGA